MPHTSEYLLIGAFAALATFVLTYPVKALATRVGWVVEPDARRVHTVTTPDVGGIAMFGGFLVAILASRFFSSFDSLYGTSEMAGVVVAAAVIFLVGLLDDVRDISAPAKVAGTVVAGLVLVWQGVTMYYFRLPLVDVFLLATDWVPLITIVWLLGMSQAINLIDGLDGLAAGVVAIAASAFFLYSRELEGASFLAEPNIGPLLCIIAVGICLGFLPHNFNPAKIFMGDGGALLLGLLMATATSVVGGRSSPNQKFFGQSYFFFAPLFIPLLILGVPIFDTLFAIVRRASRRQGMATADKGHLHHRLMNLGHGQRRSVLILWLWTALLSAFVLYPVYTNSGASLAVIGILAVGLGLFTVLHPEARRSRARHSTMHVSRTTGEVTMDAPDDLAPDPPHDPAPVPDVEPPLDDGLDSRDSA
ncbi:MAG: wecA [Ilumatobacteraceae bacterium]|nr:wecA [Ilumatobacteraceae bacterium]